MSVYFIEGPAGTGKTTRLFGELERVLEECPLTDHQQVLALTKMHGSRRRMDGRLRAMSGLRVRYRCCTADSFAWSIVRRWRTLARRKSASELAEDDYEQVCSLAGDLLAETTVSRWVIRVFPIVVVDEFQDCKGGQLAMISSLSSLATCLVAADDYQDLDLENTEMNPAVAWARTNGEGESLSDIHRTSASGVLEASRALRAGGNVPHKGDGFTVLGAKNHNVGASFVSKNLSWWSSCADIAVLTPVRPSSSPFVRDLIARVEEKPISNPPVGPHLVPWEESHEEECDRLIQGLGLPDDPNAEVCCDELSFGDVGGPRRGLRHWVERQTRVAGRMTFTAEEIRCEARRIHQRSRAHRRVRGRGVRAMTIHQAKNREFHSVIVLWPYEVAGTIERQRRLLYNAITRAKCRVLVVVQNPSRLGQPPFAARSKVSPLRSKPSD